MNGNQNWLKKISNSIRTIKVTTLAADAISKLLSWLDEHFTTGTTGELTIEIKQNNLEKTIYVRLKNDTIVWISWL